MFAPTCVRELWASACFHGLDLFTRSCWICASTCFRELRPRPVYAEFGPRSVYAVLFTRPMGRSVYAVPFTRTAASDLLTRTSGTRAAAYGPSSPLIPTSHYAPGHSDAGSRRDNIRRHIGFRSPSWFPVTIDMGDVTSGPSIDIRLKLNFKRDIYELARPHLCYFHFNLKFAVNSRCCCVT